MIQSTFPNYMIFIVLFISKVCTITLPTIEEILADLKTLCVVKVLHDGVDSNIFKSQSRPGNSIPLIVTRNRLHRATTSLQELNYHNNFRDLSSIRDTGCKISLIYSKYLISQKYREKFRYTKITNWEIPSKFRYHHLHYKIWTMTASSPITIIPTIQTKSDMMNFIQIRIVKATRRFQIIHSFAIIYIRGFSTLEFCVHSWGLERKSENEVCEPFQGNILHVFPRLLSPPMVWLNEETFSSDFALDMSKEFRKTGLFPPVLNPFDRRELI
ncbi:hypothetical protein Fcan01_27723 [Folsomia candida]|uniref:Uncharacterized protein n=1 Tax=Folsomia candida TaxID=158441 RepID=A0A226CYJ1_FOLCA|nr:hypothetical protein Fcan01_27723 [Folsomia candida]